MHMEKMLKTEVNAKFIEIEHNMIFTGKDI